MNALTPTGPVAFGTDWLARTRLAGNGEVITFYSYKGGTGRSMALVNCAGLIAQHLSSPAKPLLLVDFDLEAPGLHRYLSPYLPPPASDTPPPGLLELFESFRHLVDLRLRPPIRDVVARTRVDDDTVTDIVDSFDLTPYIVDTNIPWVSLIPAGRFDDTYPERVNHLDWEDLFNKAPAIFRQFASRLARDYSFVFIDSRTGLSDTSGICTMLLPDVLVVIFTPNAQSLTGIEKLVRSAASYRVHASDSRSLRVYPLPSRVDVQVERFRVVWRRGASDHEIFGNVTGYQPLFQTLFGSAFGMPEASSQISDYFDAVQIPHISDYSYGERLCFGVQSPADNLSIRSSYEQFLPWLVTGARPWERPSDVLIDQLASLWLHQVGMDAPPDNIDQWQLWFERLASSALSTPHPVLADLSRLSLNNRFDISVTLAIARAYRGDLQRSLEDIDEANRAYNEDISSIVPVSALINLLTHWGTHLSPEELRAPRREAWIRHVDSSMSSWLPVRHERVAWLSALIDLAALAEWQDLEQTLLEQLVNLNRDTLGEDHADTVASMNTLAHALGRQGDLAGVRDIQEKLLALNRRLFGDENPTTLGSMNDLAKTVRSQGQLARAREIHEHVLGISRRVFGEAAPQTLSHMDDLGNVLRAMGDLAGARNLQEHLLALSRRVFGERDPHTVVAMNALANTLRELGEE